MFTFFVPVIKENGKAFGKFKKIFKNLLHFAKGCAIIYRLLYPMSKNIGKF